MTAPRRVRMIDLENPFVPTFEGMCEVLLIRHGEQQFFENIPLGDALDAPLSPLGVEQARVVGERLAGARLDAVYCSPLQRARVTAGEVARYHGLAPITRDELQEIDIWQTAPQDRGLLDLYSKDELASIYRAVTSTRRFSAYPHCEDAELFKARIVAAVDHIVDENIGSRVAVVCHAGVINAYLSSLLKSGLDHVCSVHHTSITVVRGADTRRVVLTINDYHHVMAVQSARSDLNA